METPISYTITMILHSKLFVPREDPTKMVQGGAPPVINGL